MTDKLDTRVRLVRGRACPLRGDDIDTDRIIPARYLRAVTFEGLGEHAFEDDRAQAKGDHALDQDRYAGAAILVVGRNFGCGSSREHAPQALLRRGFRAFVGGSFAEIFFGNCVALGLPCVTLGTEDLGKLFDAVELDPAQDVTVDLDLLEVTCRAGTFKAGLPDGARSQLREGSWNATAVLLEAGDAIERTAKALPYFDAFAD
jgi:3-isopropylmalate/(R)-2-methylmalate dehydratase small subunit